MILGIETATQLLNLALTHEAQVLGNIFIDRQNVQDELLAPLCRDLLRYCGVTARELDGIAVSAGPGSFTGLRIGMAVAKGMAVALDIPLAAVPTMDAIALGMAKRMTDTATCNAAVVLPARKGELYWGTYILEGGKGRRTGDPVVLPVTDVPTCLGEEMVLGGIGIDLLPAQIRPPHMRILPDTGADARAVALLGTSMIETGRAVDAATCEPLYVQDFEVKQAKNVLLRP
ncbi:MAG: tRNA (adenosine(37)-N6)-threonylcarbamoyltransferase complex dimerization subunit type 1 TsaB [Bacteroidetes bacterium]|nr:tRNA (adenosine(37)-N6)-threonylcarbamoyltransferase complex dimerization subunit type 1 TsaB [Bacteroidota bacterium]